LQQRQSKVYNRNEFLAQVDGETRNRLSLIHQQFHTFFDVKCSTHPFCGFCLQAGCELDHWKPNVNLTTESRVCTRPLINLISLICSSLDRVQYFKRHFYLMLVHRERILQLRKSQWRL